MVRTTILALVGATALLSSAANAADLPPPLPPMVQPVPVVVGGWYLRGDVGVGQKSFSDFQHHQTNPVFVWPASWRIDQKDMADTAFVGFGVGYAWNNWLRFDVTGEYRMKEAFKVTGSYTEFCPNGRCFDVYEGHHSNWLVLANAYIDLGTWWCLTPFVGAGIGTAYHKFTGVHGCRPDLGRHHRLRLRGQRLLEVEHGLGAACRRRLQRHQQLQGRARRTATSTWARSIRRSSTARRVAAAPATDRAPTTPSPTTTRRTSRSACAGCSSRKRCRLPPPLIRKG